MSYKAAFDQPFHESLRTVALDEVRKAQAVFDDAARDPVERVHDIRRHTKKLRALLRLARPGDPKPARRLNRLLRDGARRLAPWRDADALLEAYETLFAHARGARKGNFAAVRRRLKREQVRAHADEDAFAEALQAMRACFDAAADAFATWPGPEVTDRVVADGAARTYGQARQAMRAALKSRRPGDLHQWRKRTKDHRYQMNILQDAWNPVLKRRRDELHVLTDYLGENHDLFVLREALRDRPGLCPEEDRHGALLALIDERRAGREALARPLGEKLFSLKPDAFRREIRSMLRARRREIRLAREIPAGPAPEAAAAG